MLVKETAIIMIPIVGLWLGYALLFKKERPHRTVGAVAVLGAVALAVAAYFGLRSVWGTATISRGTYTKRYDLNVQDMIPRVLRWATMYAFYFHYLLPLAILSFVAIAANKVKEQQQQRLFNWAAWVALWMAVLLPWEYAEVYYLLPFGLGIAVLVGHLSPSIFALFKSAKPAIRWVSFPLVALTLLLFLATLPNFLTHGRMQLAFDRANAMMLESVAQIIPQNGDLFNEPDSKQARADDQKYFKISRAKRHLLCFYRKEVFENLPRSSKGIVILPFIENQPNLTVRAGTEERYSMEHRRVIFQKMDHNLIPIAEFIKNFQIFNINFPVLLCPFLNRAGFCEIPDPVIDLTMFSYGWEVYQIP